MSQYRRSGRHRYHYTIIATVIATVRLNTAEAVDIGTKNNKKKSYEKEVSIPPKR